MTKHSSAHLLKGLVGLALIFTVACGKKVKPDGEGSGGAGGDSATISQEPMSFSASGSDSGTIAGLKTIQFGYDSSTLDSAARGTLNDNSAWIKSNKSITVQIEGHCDARGSVEYNLALGERRAKAVKDYLTSLGVDGKRLTIISYGKEKPLDNGDTEGTHAKNRRANFVPLAN